MKLTKYCPKCSRMVISMHKHHGKADFFCHPITKTWSCTHCGRDLKNNHKDCECRK